MAKSNYQLFLEIFSYIFESEDIVFNESIIEKFGKKKFTLFNRHMRGGDFMEGKTSDTKQYLTFTQKGLKFYFDLKQSYVNGLVTRMNLQATLGAVLLVLTSFLFEKLYPSSSNVALIFWGIVLLCLGIAVYLIFNAITDFFRLKNLE